MNKVPRAADIMNRNVLILTRDTTVHEASAGLAARGQFEAPVVDETGRIVGMFSQQCCMHALLGVVYDERPAGRVGGHLMLAPRSTVTPDTSLLDVAQMFDRAETLIPTLIVLERDRIVGLVSRQNVIRAILEFVGPVPDLTTAATLYISAVRDEPPCFEGRR